MEGVEAGAAVVVGVEVVAVVGVGDGGGARNVIRHLSRLHVIEPWLKNYLLLSDLLMELL